MKMPFVNPLSRGSAGLIDRARDIKTWTRERFRLPDEAVISVNELACHVPGCPPKETVVLMMYEERTVQMSIHKAILDITKDDIDSAVKAADQIEQSATTPARNDIRS